MGPHAILCYSQGSFFRALVVLMFGGGAHCARVEVWMQNTSKKHVNYSFGKYILIYLLYSRDNSHAQEVEANKQYKGGHSTSCTIHLTSRIYYFPTSHMPLSHPSEWHIVGVHLLVTGNDNQLLALGLKNRTPLTSTR